MGGVDVGGRTPSKKKAKKSVDVGGRTYYSDTLGRGADVAGRRPLPGGPSGLTPTGTTGQDPIGALLRKDGSPSAPGLSGFDTSLAERDRRASATARFQRQDRGRGFPQGEEGGEDVSQKSFADFLREAMDMLGGGGGGVNYDPQRADLKSRAAQGDAALAAMYNQLQQKFAAQAPVIAGDYAQAQGDVSANTAQAQSNLDQSNTAIRDEQTRQLGALGIGDAAGTLIANGNNQVADQQVAAGGIQQNGAAVINQLVGNGAAAQTFNTEIGQTAGLEGASKRAQLQMDLQQKLAALGAAEQEANANAGRQSQSSALSLASQLFGADRQDADTDYQHQQDAFNALLEQQTAQATQQHGVDPQSILDAVAGYSKQNGQPKDATEYVRLLDAFRKLYS